MTARTAAHWSLSWLGRTRYRVARYKELELYSKYRSYTMMPTYRVRQQLAALRTGGRDGRW
ncbi:MAG TPA: hypothetical protein VGN51_20705 [Acidimicrobiia bacterium]